MSLDLGKLLFGILLRSCPKLPGNALCFEGYCGRCGEQWKSQMDSFNRQGIWNLRPFRNPPKCTWLVRDKAGIACGLLSTTRSKVLSGSERPSLRLRKKGLTLNSELGTLGLRWGIKCARPDPLTMQHWTRLWLLQASVWLWDCEPRTQTCLWGLFQGCSCVWLYSHSDRCWTESQSPCWLACLWLMKHERV